MNTNKKNNDLDNLICEAFKTGFHSSKEIDKFNITKDDNTEDFPKKYKIKINRLFREQIRGTHLPHPEVDSWFERTRSWIVIWINSRRKRK